MQALATTSTLRETADLMDLTGLQQRVLDIVGDRTYRAVADMTSQNAETVRRYLQGLSPPSVEFVAALCAALDINADWLLTGRGPLRASENKSYALRDANPAELLSAVATTLERLADRVDRIELYVQMLETRLRARPGVSDRAGHGQEAAVHDVGQTAAHGVAERAASIADALPRRPRPDAG